MIVEDFPFAENEQIVRLIVHDLFWAAWAVPVICWGVYKAKSSLDAGRAFGVLSGGATIAMAIGWFAHLMMAWALPTNIAIDVDALRRRDPAAFAAISGNGKVGYFNCTLALSPGRTLEWSSRKIYAWDDAAGTRWLWVEGNADESAEIAKSLATASATLAFSPPTVRTIDAWTARHTENRIPLMNQHCVGREPANVLLFREPNGYVTPCLLMRL